MLRCQIEEDAGALNNEKSRREERLISELFFLNFFLGSALQRVELFFYLLVLFRSFMFSPSLVCLFSLG